VRRRFDDLRAAVWTYYDVAAKALVVAEEVSASEERTAIAYRLHHRLRQIFPAMLLRTATLRERLRGDLAAVEALDELDLAIARANSEIELAFNNLLAEQVIAE
jgi:hypothetical protein